MRKDPLSKDGAVERYNSLRVSPRTEEPERLEVYPCKYGEHFHVGHVPRKKRPDPDAHIGATEKV